MLILMQGRIFIEVPVYLLPSVSALSKILLCASRHVVNVAWTKVVIVYEILSHFPITMFLGWLQILPRIKYLNYCNHIFPI